MKKTLILIAAIPLFACSTYADGGDDAQPDSAGEETVAENDTPSGERTYTDEERKFLDSVNWCREEGLEKYVGMQVTDALVADAMKISGSKAHRVLAPGMAASMDYRTDRLNIMTDENGVVVEFRCG